MKRSIICEFSFIILFYNNQHIEVIQLIKINQNVEISNIKSRVSNKEQLELSPRPTITNLSG